MTISDAYLQFLLLVNRNATGNNINVDKPRFIFLFNDIQNRYVEWILEKRNDDEIRYVAPLLVLESPLSVVDVNTTHNTYGLPTDYFDFSNLHVFGSKGCCENSVLRTFEAKSEDIEELFADVNNRPSLEWEETFYIFSNKQVAVYKDDFELDRVLLSYYRYPNTVDIAGYIRSDDGSNSTSIDSEFDDKVVNRILVACAKEFAAMNNDQVAYQLDNNRLFTKI